NWDAEIRLIRERDGKEVQLRSFSVLDDGLAQVNMDELWQEGEPEAGEYTLRLDSGGYGSFEQRIELTVDTRYRTRSYGLLAIVKRGTQYEIEPVADEKSLADLSGEVLLTIRGKVLEIRSG